MAFLPENARIMLEKLIQMTLRLGRAPSFDEVKQDPNMPHPNDYAFYFGSYTSAKEEAYRYAFVYRDHSLPESPKRGEKITIEEDEYEMGRKSVPTALLAASLLRLKTELGHFPNITDVRADKRCLNPATYEKRLGNIPWNKMERAIENWVAAHREEVDRALEELGTDREVIPATKPSSKKAASPPPEPLITEEKKQEPPLPRETISDVLYPAVTEIMPPTEIEECDARVVSLLPKLAVKGMTVSEYAAVVQMKGSAPSLHYVRGIPISRSFSSLQLCSNGKITPFPEPCDGIYYIVERDIAMIAHMAGRTTDDLLIPKKYDKDDKSITIQEFAIL